MKPLWEYEVVMDLEIWQCLEILNGYGEKGWECFSTIATTQTNRYDIPIVSMNLFFKRIKK